MDRAARKIIVENGGKHPASLTSLLYLLREKGGRGLLSVEHKYKITKIKSLLKLYQNSDQTVEAVREFEEHAMASGHQSLVKKLANYAEELNITLQLDTLNPVCVTTEGKVVTAARAGNLLKQSQEKQFLEIAKDKKWQGKLFRIRWEDESLSITSCFAWLTEVGLHALHIPSRACMNCMSSCYLRSSTQRRRRKPPPTAKFYAGYVGR